MRVSVSSMHTIATGLPKCGWRASRRKRPRASFRCCSSGRSICTRRRLRWEKVSRTCTHCGTKVRCDATSGTACFSSRRPDANRPMKKHHRNTSLVTGGRDRRKSFDFVNPPIVRGSTVLHDDVADMERRVQARLDGADGLSTYGIYGTPTHHAFYEALTELEGGY